MTPASPRAVSSLKKASQPAPSALMVTCTPRISRFPSLLTPATKNVHGHDTAAFAELEDQGVGSTKVNGPASWRRQGAELPNVLVELLGPHETWLLDRPVMQRVWEPATVNPSYSIVQDLRSASSTPPRTKSSATSPSTPPAATNPEHQKTPEPGVQGFPMS